MQKKTHCLVLVDSRYGYERDFTIELKYGEGLIEDRLKCQISLLVKYLQNQIESMSMVTVQLIVLGLTTSQNLNNPYKKYTFT